VGTKKGRPLSRPFKPKPDEKRGEINEKLKEMGKEKQEYKMSGADRARLLDIEYQRFISNERIKWHIENRFHSRNVWEVMSEYERKEVAEYTKKWARHITPISEKWWKERGYGVIWPENDEDPMKVYELE